MPHKHNDKKRHHIPKTKYTITNWPQYEAGLKQRGSLPLWITPEAIAEWKAAARESPGGQPRYSDLAIQACLMGLMGAKLQYDDICKIQRSISRLTAAS